MSKSTEKEVIPQHTINLNGVDAEILKSALIESNFLDSINTQRNLSKLVQINFNVNDFLLENDSLDIRSEKSRLSCFFQGYYELCKEIHDSKRKVDNISPEALKKMVLKSRVFDNIIDTAGVISFYTAVILLVDSMFQDEIVEPKEKSRIIALINLYNSFLSLLIAKP